MDIVIDARLLLPGQWTGIGRYLVGLAQGFAALEVDDRFEFWLQPGLPQDHPLRRCAGPCIRLAEVPISHKSLQAQWNLPRAVHKRKPDLYHSPHFDLPYLLPGPAVATIHDLKYLLRPDFFPQQGWLRRLIILAMVRITLWKARLVIVDSNHTSHDLVHRLKAQTERLRVVPLGVEERFFERLPSQALVSLRERYRLSDEYILFLGERRPHKNLPGLLRTFARLQAIDPHPGRQLVIAGHAYADYREPERLAEKLGLSTVVRFIDHPPDSDLPGLYQAAGALALLSYYEGFGLPVLEAMAGGTPVVASDTTSLPEVAGCAGILVHPDNPDTAASALQTVLPGGAEREERISAGLAHARRFTWTACARRTLEIYHEAL